MLRGIIAHLGKIVPRDIYHFFMTGGPVSKLVMNLFLDNIFLLCQTDGFIPKGSDHDSDLKGWMRARGLGSNVPSLPGASGGIIPTAAV
jgi:hypothetical protein